MRQSSRPHGATRAALLGAAVLLCPLRALAAPPPRPAEAELTALRAVVAALPSGTTTAPARALAGACAELALLVRRWPADRSPTALPTEPLVALFAGGLALGGEEGERHTSLALDRLTPPRRHPVVTATAGGPPFLKAGDQRFREVCLTFDDGPGPGTEALLDVLDARSAKAVFFLVGRNTAGREATVRRIHAGGHLIGNHTWSHPRLSRLDTASVVREVDRFDTGLGTILGQDPGVSLFRLPFNAGKSSTRVHRALAGHFRYVVDWTIDSRDWELRRADTVLERVLAQPLKKGAILLLHDGRQSPWLPGLVDRLVAALEEKGFTLVTLDQLLGEDQDTARRRELAEALAQVAAGQERAGYRGLLALARDNPASEEADDALFAAGVLAGTFTDKRSSIPGRVSRYLSRRYAGSPLAPPPSPPTRTE